MSRSDCATSQMDRTHRDVDYVAPRIHIPDARRTDRRLVLLTPGLLALVVCLYQMRLPNVLYGSHDYGEGVYLGVALRLVHGAVPYRDFVFVHPPGIALLMTPVAAIGGSFGTYTSLAIARDLTLLVTAANACLAALVVRHRGTGASLLAGTALACFPLAPAADSAVLLEPYLVLFLLLGLVLMFQDGRLAPPRRLMLAGLAFGFAGAVKLWAILVIVPVLVVAAVSLRRAPARLAAGIAVGFVTPCLPFFLLAPGAFIRDVLVVQADRVVGATASSVPDRIAEITGVAGIGVLGHSTAIGLAVGVMFVALVGSTFVLTSRSMKPADWTLLLSGVAGVVALLAASSWFGHYAYFAAAFVAMLFGECASKLVQHALPKHGGAHDRFRRTSVAVVCTAMVALLAPAQAAFARASLSDAVNPLSLNLFVPAGSCVLADYPSLLIAADLYQSTRPGCPEVVDPYGTWLAYGPPHTPPYAGPYPASFVTRWQQWLQASDFAVTRGRYSILIPWTPALRAWFARTFYLVSDQGGLYVYCHVVPGASAVPNPRHFADPCLARHPSPA